MKYLKMLCLAAFAAMAMTAFLGVGTASATVLCKTKPTTVGGEATCPGSWDYGIGSTFEWTLAAGKSVNVMDAGVTTTCTKSTIVSKTANTGSKTETVKRNVETLTFENCTCNGNTAHVTVLEKGSLEVHRIITTYNGQTTVKGRKITITCTSLALECIYTASDIELGAETEGSESDLDVEATINWEAGDDGSFACSGLDTKAQEQGPYRVTKPTTAFFVADYAD